jgi:hypothetical protein
MTGWVPSVAGLAGLLCMSTAAVASTPTAEFELSEPELPRAWVAAADARPRLLVLDLRATLGVEPELARLLGDMVVTRLHTIGQHEVVSTADVAAMLDVETQKQLLGCSDDACLAEIGGALDAGFLVTGSLSRLGERDVVTLKLLDTGASKLVNQLTEELPGDQGEYEEAMRVASYNLLSMDVPELPTAWYESVWLWAAVGAVVVGGTVTAVVLAQPASAPDAELGQVVLDGR